MYFNERKHLAKLNVSFGLNYILRKNIHEDLPIVDNLTSATFPKQYEEYSADYINSDLSKKLRWKNFTFNESKLV